MRSTSRTSQLTQAPGSVPAAFNAIRLQLASAGFNEPEKVYLVYYDGSTGQSGREQICGQGATPSGLGLPVWPSSTSTRATRTAGDSLRPVVGMHELVHVLGAVNDAAPHRCSEGHVCDFELDLMGSALSGNELESHVLDSGHDDYYAHAGSWPDVQDSLFLERLDSPDRSAPTAPAALIVRSTPARRSSRSRGAPRATTSAPSPTGCTRTGASVRRCSEPLRC